MNCIDRTDTAQHIASRCKSPMRRKTGCYGRMLIPISSVLDGDQEESSKSLNLPLNALMLVVVTAIVILIAWLTFNAVSNLITELHSYSTWDYLAAMSGTEFPSNELLP